MPTWKKSLLVLCFKWRAKVRSCLVLPRASCALPLISSFFLSCCCPLLQGGLWCRYCFWCQTASIAVAAYFILRTTVKLWNYCIAWLQNVVPVWLFVGKFKDKAETLNNVARRTAESKSPDKSQGNTEGCDGHPSLSFQTEQSLKPAHHRGCKDLSHIKIIQP